MSAYITKDIPTSDGRKLVSRFFQPQGNIIGAVLIVPAMGTSQDYYAAFASWLSSQGFLVATFDYRGTGLSRSGSLRGFKATILDWAELDCSAMVEAVSASAENTPIYWIGHSLGGQILPFITNRIKISKAITVAAGSGYWRENSPSLRHYVWWLWYFVAPVANALFGYFPGKRLRKVGDLPKGVMEQWRSWCLNPNYAVGVEGDKALALYADVEAPIISISFTDDEFMSARNIESLHHFYMNAPRTMIRINPKDLGMKNIGHFGFFKAKFADSLWREYILPEIKN